MKKTITSLCLMAVLSSTSLLSPSLVQAAPGQGNDRESQLELVSLLQQLINKYQELLNLRLVVPNKSVDTLSLDTNLADLALGHYEGWLIVGDKKISTGKFDATDDMEFSVNVKLKDIDKVVVTIEPEGDDDAVPSGIVVLVGLPTHDGSVDLSFPVDFKDAAGSVILATPTNGSGTDETSGIWFLNLPDPSVSLELPVLPAGWVYEGWAVNKGTPVTSGRFTDLAAADDFAGFSGSEGAPPFPGEDFLENEPAEVSFPLDLADGSSKIVISVEPDLNGEDPTGDGPAQAKPLVVDVVEGQADHTNFSFDLNIDSIPAGSALLK